MEVGGEEVGESKVAERPKSSILKEVDETQKYLLGIKPPKEGERDVKRAEILKALGYPPFVEMTPGEIAKDDELLFHGTPGKTAIKVLTRGSIESKMAQREKYGEAEAYTQFSSFPKDSGISFARGGTYYQGGEKGAVFAFRARELLPGTQFDEFSHDPGEIRIYDQELGPKKPEKAKGSSINLKGRNFVILVGEGDPKTSEGDWFLEEVRQNWENFEHKGDYEDAEEFIEKHVVSIPRLLRGKIYNYLLERQEEVLKSPSFKSVVEDEYGGDFKEFASMTDGLNYSVGGALETVFRLEVFNELYKDPKAWSWNIAEQKLCLKTLEQEFNSRFPVREAPPLVKIEETDKRFGIPNETPLRKASLVTS